MSKYISDLVICTILVSALTLGKLAQSALRLTITQYATNEGSGAAAHLEPSPFANIYRQSRRLSPTHLFYHFFFTEISPYKAPHNEASGLECAICL